MSLKITDRLIQSGRYQLDDDGNLMFNNQGKLIESSEFLEEQDLSYQELLAKTIEEVKNPENIEKGKKYLQYELYEAYRAKERHPDKNDLQKAYDNKVETLSQYGVSIDTSDSEKMAEYATYKKYKNYRKYAVLTTDEDIQDYAENYIRRNNNIIHKNSYAGIATLSEEFAQWAQYSYEEILQMQASGVLIPDEVLEWAYGQQDQNAGIVEEGEDFTDGENGRQGELKELEKKAQALGQKAQDDQEANEVKFVKFEETSKKAEAVKQEQENAQKNSLKKLEDLTQEWVKLQDKMKTGELSEADKARYQELGKLLNGEDGELMKDIQTTNAELEDLMNTMDGLNKDSAEGVETGDEAVSAATDLALSEAGYKSDKKEPNFFINMAVGEMKDKIFGAEGQSIARIALDQGNKLIEFSNTLADTLMMNQYVSLYEFAQDFTAGADEGIDKTKEVMGEDFNKSSEEFETPQVEENIDEQAENEEKSQDPEALKQYITDAKGIIPKIIDTGNKSEAMGEDALKEAQEAHKETEQLTKEKETKSVQVQTAQQESTQAIEESEEPQNTEDVEDTQETQETQEENATEETTEVEDIDKKIEDKNTKELKGVEKFNKFHEINNEYTKYNKTALNGLTFTTMTGTASIATGVYLGVTGQGMIEAGTALAATASAMATNPYTMIVAGVLAEQAATLIASGSAMLGTGIGLGVVGGGMVAYGEVGAQEAFKSLEMIDVSELNIDDATEIMENKEADENLTEAQGLRKEMTRSGMTLSDQAKEFTKMSAEQIGQVQKSSVEVLIRMVQSEIEAKKSEATAKVVEMTMKDEKEEYDKLAEKKEKFEESQDDAINQAKSNPNGKIEEVEEFTKSDETKMNELKDKLGKVGDKAQQSLYNSLTKVEGLEEFLAGKDAIALSAEDYGQVTEIVGKELLDNTQGNILLINYIVLGLAALTTGKTAQKSGKDLDKISDDALETNNTNKATITNAQSRVEKVTMSPADDSESGNEQEENEENKQENNKADNASQTQEVTSDNYKSAASEGNKGLSSALSQTNKDNAETLEVKKDSEKDEKTLTKQMKNVEKELKNEEKQNARYRKQIEADNAQVEALATEAEVLTAQVMAAVETAKAKQSNAKQTGGAAPISATDKEQKSTGLLSKSNGLLSGSGKTVDVSNETAIITNGQARLNQISTTVRAFGSRISQTTTKAIKSQAKVNKTHRRFEKLAKERIKVQKELQKAEKAKQDRLNKTLAVVGVFNSIFSVVLAIGTILSAIPFTAAVGAVMMNVGMYGVAFCGVVKATIQIANGNLKEGLLTLATTAMTIAMSLIPGAGAAAEGSAQAAASAMSVGQSVLQITSGASSVVSSSCDMIGNIQVLEGETPDETLATVSQVAGLVAATTSVASGFAGGSKNIKGEQIEKVSSQFSQGNTLSKIAMISNAAGTALTTTAQISTLIKQANGEQTGDFENIMSIVGASLTTAGSLMTMANTISESVNATADDRQAKREEKRDARAERQQQKQDARDAKQAAREERQQQRKAEKDAKKTDNQEQLQPEDKKFEDQKPEDKKPEDQKPENKKPEDKKLKDEKPEIIIPELQKPQKLDEMVPPSQRDQTELPVVDRENFEKLAAIDNDILPTSQEVLEEQEQIQQNKSREQFNKQIEQKRQEQIEQNKAEALEKQQKQEEKERLDKYLDAGGKAVQSGTQIASTIAAFTANDANKTKNRNVLQMSDMKKGKSLIRKIERRKQGSMYNNRYAKG